MFQNEFVSFSGIQPQRQRGQARQQLSFLLRDCEPLQGSDPRSSEIVSLILFAEKKNDAKIKALHDMTWASHIMDMEDRSSRKYINQLTLALGAKN